MSLMSHKQDAGHPEKIVLQFPYPSLPTKPLIKLIEAVAWIPRAMPAGAQVNFPTLLVSS